MFWPPFPMIPPANYTIRNEFTILIKFTGYIDENVIRHRGHKVPTKGGKKETKLLCQNAFDHSLTYSTWNQQTNLFFVAIAFLSAIVVVTVLISTARITTAATTVYTVGCIVHIVITFQIIFWMTSLHFGPNINLLRWESEK